MRFSIPLIIAIVVAYIVGAKYPGLARRVGL